MKLKIEITLDNDAFYQDPGFEVSRILTDLARRIEFKKTFDGYEAHIMDHNGNRVGKLTTT